MIVKASVILARERSYIGIKEDPPGSNNVIFNTVYYGHPVSNSSTASYPWCMAMQWCAFADENASELFLGGGRTASCGALMNYAKAHGQWVTSDYRLGDIVMYNWEQNVNLGPDHAGFVITADNDYVYTIEGNTSDSDRSSGGEVLERKREMKYVIGAYRPNYEPEEETMSDQDFLVQLKRVMENSEFMQKFVSVLTIAGTGDNKDAWADAATETLKEAGIFSGDGNGNYGWKLPITREAAAQVIYNVLQKAGLLEEIKKA